MPYLFCNNVYCQSYNESIPQQDKNAIYFALGTSVLWHGASLTYEKRSKKICSNKNISSFVKSGVGYYRMGLVTKLRGNGHSQITVGSLELLITLSSAGADLCLFW